MSNNKRKESDAKVEPSIGDESKIMTLRMKEDLEDRHIVRSIGSDPQSVAGRPSNEADLLGQVFTPQAIAAKMARELLRGRGRSGLIILDPAVGPGTFPISLHATGKLIAGDKLVLRDIDKKMIARTRRALAMHRGSADGKCCDYLEEEREPCDLVIMNPPYIRQEWIDKKEHYRIIFQQRYGTQVPGTSNLYVYFVIKALAELRSGGKMVCIVYDSWLFTKFGRWLAGILKANCNKVEITNVTQQPFPGREIDATIIKATRSSSKFTGRPDETAVVSTHEHSPLSGVDGAVPLHTLFHTKRGLRLKQADFFLIDLAKGLGIGATPFVKKPGRLSGYVVPNDHSEAALLHYPGSAPNPEVIAEMNRRLELAKIAPENNISILTWHEKRLDSWYLHRKAPYAPIIFNYYLRGLPRHIYNPKRAYSDNFYGLTPLRKVDPFLILAVMNSSYVCLEILNRARNQGHGLQKIQLYEYRNVLVPDWTRWGKETLATIKGLGKVLLKSSGKTRSCIRAIDEAIAHELDANKVSLAYIDEQLRQFETQKTKGLRLQKCVG